MTGPRRYSFPDAMRYLNASKRSLRRWVAEGDIDCLRIGARVYFLTEQLVAFQLKRGRFNKDPRKREQLEASLANHAEFQGPLAELAARVERLEVEVFNRKEAAA